MKHKQVRELLRRSIERRLIFNRAMKNGYLVEQHEVDIFRKTGVLRSELSSYIKGQLRQLGETFRL